MPSAPSILPYMSQVFSLPRSCVALEPLFPVNLLASSVQALLTDGAVLLPRFGLANTSLRSRMALLPNELP